MARTNNFDAMRLIAAVAVLFSHSFLIAEGTQANEPLVRLTGNQCILGLLAVFVFFCISGFLVTQSWFATLSPGRFVMKRGLRIFPGLLMSLLVCGLVVGPLVSSLPVGAYFGDPSLYRFIAESLALALGDHPLPGVAFSDNSVGYVVNGSLWTLRYEVMMYAMVLALGRLGLLRLSTSVFLVGLGIAAIWFEKDLDALGDIGEWAWMVGFFASGMVLYFLRASRLLRGEVAVLAALGLVLSTEAHQLILWFALFGGFLAIYGALKHWAWLDPLSRFGDLSYGVYLYGWPVAACIVWAQGGRAAWWQVFAASLPLCLLLAFLSWHGVEKWALRLARRSGMPRRPSISDAHAGAAALAAPGAPRALRS